MQKKMVKAKCKEAPMKPKFQQTKLCFSSFASPISKQKDTQQTIDSTKKLEKSIQDLNIGKGSLNQKNNHPDPCKDCEKTIKRVKCTALKNNTKEACTLSYCIDCIMSKVQEDLNWIENNTVAKFVHLNGQTIRHINSAGGIKWACLVCRGLCDCKLCEASKLKAPILSFNVEPINSSKKIRGVFTDITPPELKPVKMLYSEQELWTRLQIREFIFRFGDLYNFDNKIVSCLQNVQGDWRVKRLGAYIVWHFLLTIYNSANYEFPQEEKEESISLTVRKILNKWISEKNLDNLCFDREGKHQAMMDVLNTEGMTGRRWQDIGELLAMARFEDIPVPTSRGLRIAADITDDNSEHDDMMEVDSEEQIELESNIKRYQKATTRSNLISAEDELKMMNMLLELLLFDEQIRQSLVAAGKNTMTKELRDEELEFKKYHKEWLQENTKNVMRRTSLAKRKSLLESTKGKITELKQAEADMEALEILIRDENQNLSKKKLELAIHVLKAEKRMKVKGCDMFGNEYWMFNDILDHLNNAKDYRNSEPYWAYGVIIIGPGFNNSNSSDKKWWYIEGKDSLKSLKNWIANEAKRQLEYEDELKRIVVGISDRLGYLNSLETAVYGETFFQ